MTTYYVSPTGSNTFPYDTWEKAANLPSTALGVGNGDANGPHTMYIAPGEYANNLAITDAQWENGVIIGTVAHGSIGAASKGQIILSTTNYVVRCLQSGVTVKNISMTGSDGSHALLYLDGANFIGDNLYLFGGDSYAISAASAADGFEISHSRITVHGDAVLLYGNGTIHNCIFDFSDGYSGKAIWAIPPAGVVQNIYNCTIFATHRGIEKNGAGTLNLKNNIIMALHAGSYAIYKVDGTINAENNYIGVNWWDEHRQVYGALDTDTANLKTGVSPYVKRHKRSGYVIPCFDDADGYEYVAQVESLLASSGVKGTFFVEAYAATRSPTTISAIQAIINRGIVTIGGHSYSHSYLDKSGTDVALTITKAGATITISRAGDTITIDPGGTVTGFKAKKISTIKAEMEALGCTVDISTSLELTSLGEVFNDATGVSPLSGNYLIDTSLATGLFKVEIADAYTVLQANFSGLGSTMVFASPYGQTSNDLQAAIANSDWAALRSQMAESDSEYLLNNIDLMQLGYVTSSVWVGATDAETIANVVGVAEMVAEVGGIVFLLSHSATEATVADWLIALDVLKKYPEIKVTSADEAINDIRNGGLWSSGDSRVYTRTFTDQSNYKLKSGSPCIEAGANLGADYALDHAGRDQDRFGRGWEIGAYVFPVASGFGVGF